MWATRIDLPNHERLWELNINFSSSRARWLGEANRKVLLYGAGEINNRDSQVVLRCVFVVAKFAGIFGLFCFCSSDGLASCLSFVATGRIYVTFDILDACKKYFEKIQMWFRLGGGGGNIAHFTWRPKYVWYWQRQDTAIKIDLFE
jgi:hypothetical protein